MKILCIGEEWKGSNSSGLFYALSRIGCITNIVNELKYISVNAESFAGKAINSIVRPVQVNDFNKQLIPITKSFLPNVIIVYKGAFLKPSTILFWRKLGIPVVNFFPDVSFLAHGKYIPQCVPLYDHIFTTKSFGADDLLTNFNYPVDQVSFIPHAFDPLIHRKMEANVQQDFACEASFIGNYSKHKAQFLKELKRKMPSINLKIWGGTWKVKRSSRYLNGVIQGLGIRGDLYSLAINRSKINLALLSEKVKGASMGDQITSRTFHIPGCGGFMLHERTKEVLEYFEEDKEIVCFSSEDEFIDKIGFYLKHDCERYRIQEQGYERSLKEHSIDCRAKAIVEILKKKGYK